MDIIYLILYLTYLLFVVHIIVSQQLEIFI